MLKSSFIPLVSIFIISLYVLSSCGERPEHVSFQNSTYTVLSGGTSTSSTINKTVSYGTPSGIINTTFVMSLNEDSTIKTIVATSESRDHEDIQYANRFNNSAKSKIVGKKISELSSISIIGGASLTTEAFKKAISTI